MTKSGSASSRSVSGRTMSPMTRSGIVTGSRVILNLMAPWCSYARSRESSACTRSFVIALPLALVVRAERTLARCGGVAGERTFIPVQAEPAEAVEDDFHGRLRVARGVGVLDAQDEGATRVAGIEPVEERGAGAADVEKAGGTGGEADSRFHGVKRKSVSRCGVPQSRPAALHLRQAVPLSTGLCTGAYARFTAVRSGIAIPAPRVRPRQQRQTFDAQQASTVGWARPAAEVGDQPPPSLPGLAPSTHLVPAADAVGYTLDAAPQLLLLPPLAPEPVQANERRFCQTSLPAPRPRRSLPPRSI
jgi:hypothetical protein